MKRQFTRANQLGFSMVLAFVWLATITPSLHGEDEADTERRDRLLAEFQDDVARLRPPASEIDQLRAEAARGLIQESLAASDAIAGGFWQEQPLALTYLRHKSPYAQLDAMLAMIETAASDETQRAAGLICFIALDDPKHWESSGTSLAWRFDAYEKRPGFAGILIHFSPNPLVVLDELVFTIKEFGTSPAWFVPYAHASTEDDDDDQGFCVRRTRIGIQGLPRSIQQKFIIYPRDGEDTWIQKSND